MQFLFAQLALVLVSVAAGAEDWNQFRGPRADGTTNETELPITFGEGTPEIVWKTPVSGRAWSSPVVWGKQIWITNAPELAGSAKEPTKLEKPLDLTALCLDLDSGKIIHQLKMFEIHTAQVTHATNSYASPTPFIEEGKVYLHYGAYGTACVDTTTGKKIWERTDILCDHFRGPGSSPVVYGDLLYLTFDGFDSQYITALNKKTGETAWKTDRNVDFGTNDGDAKKAYSTPLLITVDGQQQLISPFASATCAYEPLTGKVIWTARHGGMNASGRPLFGNGLLYVSTADGPNPLVAIAPNGTGDITDKIQWKSNKSIPKRPSSLLINNRLYMINDSGVASCMDATNGNVLWTKRLQGEFWASPLYANGLIYSFSQTGKIYIFKAAEEFEMVAENTLDDGFIASPAVAGKSLIVRSKTHLYKIEKPASK